jgi:hypothetical protein
LFVLTPIKIRANILLNSIFTPNLWYVSCFGLKVRDHDQTDRGDGLNNKQVDAAYEKETVRLENTGREFSRN